VSDGAAGMFGIAHDEVGFDTNTRWFGSLLGVTNTHFTGFTAVAGVAGRTVWITVQPIGKRGTAKDERTDKE